MTRLPSQSIDGDRSKYLAYLRSRGISQKDYRKEIEEDQNTSLAVLIGSVIIGIAIIIAAAVHG